VTQERTREKLEDQRSAQWDAVLLRQIGYSDHQRNETIKTMLHAHLKERMGTMVEMLDDGEEEGQP
jgi:endo-1,4-beta-mannosidase